MFFLTIISSRYDFVLNKEGLCAFLCQLLGKKHPAGFSLANECSNMSRATTS